MFPIYLIYGPLLLIPGLFLLSSVLRICYHFRDSKERGKTPFRRFALTKKLMALLLAFTNALCIFDIQTSAWTDFEIIIRGVYFLTNAVAWLVSFYLVSFESSRQLESLWTGQRGFWPMNLFSTLVCIGLQLYVILFDYSSGDEMLFLVSRCALDALSGVFCCIMTYLALVHPSDFFLMGQQSLMLSDHTNIKRTTRFFKRQISIDLTNQENAAGVSATITDFKAKLTKGIVIFRVLVKIGDSEHSIQRQFGEFKTLHEVLRSKFSLERFPSLQFPTLPQVSGSGLNIDEKIQRLNDYLSELCVPELLTEELLSFFGIEGKNRTELLSKHEFALRALGYLEASPSARSLSFEEPETPDRVSFTPQISGTIYLTISMKTWTQSPEPDRHIDYTIEWKCLSFPQVGTVLKRFNEFYELHQNLKNILTPSHLPTFPKKNYLPSFKKGIDENAINMRMGHLEEYLTIVCNDPAYLCDLVLRFLSCPVPCSDLWAYRTLKHDYSLFLPITWEGEIGDDENHYTVYLLTFLRKDPENASSTLQWEVARRFREFDKLHQELGNRYRSPVLSQHSLSQGLPEAPVLPQLPRKGLVPLNTHVEIEQRRKGLQTYIQELLKIPGIMDSYAFRMFIQEPADPLPTRTILDTT